MADRDVKLIIRAKNDASRAIDSVSDALKVLTDAQAKVSSGAAKTDNSIGKLGDELAKMNAKIAGMQAMTKLSGHLDRAGQGVERLRVGLGNATANFQKYANSAEEAGTRVKELEAEVTSLRSRLEQEKSAQDTARSAMAKTAAAQKELTAARREYNKALKVKVDVADRDDGITKAKARLDAAEASVLANKQAYEALRSTYQATRKELTALGATLRDATNTHKQFQSSADSAAVALERQQASLAKGEAEYSELNQMIQKTAAGFGVAGKEQSQLATSTAKLLPEVARLSAVLAGLERYSTGGKNFVDPKTAARMRDLRIEAERTEKTWKTLEAEAGRLAREMRGVAKPTEQQVAAFKQIVSAAAAAKAEYRSLQASLHAVSGSGKASLPVTDALIKADIRRADGLRKLAAASREAAAQQVRDNAVLAAEARKAAEQQAAVVQAARNRYSDGAGGFADPAAAASLRASNAAIAEAEARLKALRTAYAQLNATTQLGKSATAQQKVEMQALATAADHAEKELNQLRGALNNVAGGMRNVRAAGSGMFGGINRESRQAMSVFQRLRGEVLALATAYVGLYGTISNVGGVISAYQQLEAAQNRLGAVFNQDDSKVAQELGFIERQAARLGIEFGSLANQYSKFAVSAQAANFTNEETRRVFLSVAEAGRVNKLSLEDMNGIFLALTQMIQKGRIGSEELRQQLGERLPGAINIMADALGVTTAELAKMMEGGEVLANSTNLLKFADQLDKRFGSQLTKSLQSTTTEIGKFWNSIFQAQLLVAKGGFIESFNRLLKEMNDWFKSRDGRDFFLALGAAAGKAVDVLRMVAENIDIVGKILGGLVALKVGAWFAGIVNNAIAAVKNINVLGGSVAGLATKQTVAAASTSRMTAAFGAAAGASQMFGTSLLTVQGRAAAMNSAVLLGTTALTTFTTRAGLAAAGSRVLSGAMAAAAGGVRILGIALTALGGPVGILVTLATIIGGSMLADWATGVDNATAALDEHQRIMGEVLTAYDQVKGKTDDWASAIKNVSLDQANANLRTAMATFEELRRKAEGLSKGLTTYDFAGMAGLNPLNTEIRKQYEDFKRLAGEFANGQITAKKYREELSKLYEAAATDAIRQFLESQLDAARATEEAADQAALAAEVAKGLGSAIDLVSQALGLSEERLKDQAEASKETAEGYDRVAASAKIADDAINTLKENIPELKEEMDALKKQTELTTTAWQGFTAALASGDFGKAMEILGLLGRAGTSLSEKGKNWEAVYTAGRGTPEGDQMAELVAAVTALSKEIGVSAKDLLTVMSYETGGTFDPWKAGPTTQWGQHRGLIQWGEPQREKYGVSESSSITEQVVAAGKYLTDAGVKAGDGLLQIYAAINAGSPTKIYASDENNGGAPGTVLDKVSGQMDGHKARAEGLLSAYGGVATEAENTYESEKKITEEKAKQQEATDKALADLGFENEMLEKKMAGKDREVFIEEELRRLREQNPNITDAELAQAEALLNKKWDYQKALSAEKDEKKQIKEIEQQINDLETQRNALLAQRRIYEEQGNTEKMQEVDGELAAVNQKLQEAIEKSILLMQALGGEGADAAIAKMKTLGLEIQNANTGGQKFAMTAQQMSDTIFQNLESGIINAFQSFAQAVANGEDAVEALGIAFRQFAANFLLEIAQMIIKQTLFNALQSFSKSLGGGLFNFLSMHTGGVVGSSGGGTIAASPAWFNNAMRYHTGGIAGLAPDEVPAILRVGEEVLTETDPRHRANGGGASGKNTKVVNLFDAPSFLSEALNSKIGEEAILNFVRANPGAFKAALG